jgi:hypothetical protein
MSAFFNGMQISLFVANHKIFYHAPFHDPAFLIFSDSPTLPFALIESSVPRTILLDLSATIG